MTAPTLYGSPFSRASSSHHDHEHPQDDDSDTDENRPVDYDKALNELEEKHLHASLITNLRFAEQRIVLLQQQVKSLQKHVKVLEPLQEQVEEYRHRIEQLEQTVELLMSGSSSQDSSRLAGCYSSKQDSVSASSKRKKILRWNPVSDSSSASTVVEAQEETVVVPDKTVVGPEVAASVDEEPVPEVPVEVQGASEPNPAEPSVDKEDENQRPPENARNQADGFVRPVDVVESRQLPTPSTEDHTPSNLLPAPAQASPPTLDNAPQVVSAPQTTLDSWNVGDSAEKAHTPSLPTPPASSRASGEAQTPAPPPLPVCAPAPAVVLAPAPVVVPTPVPIPSNAQRSSPASNAGRVPSSPPTPAPAATTSPVPVPVPAPEAPAEVSRPASTPATTDPAVSRPTLPHASSVPSTLPSASTAVPSRKKQGGRKPSSKAKTEKAEKVEKQEKTEKAKNRGKRKAPTTEDKDKNQESDSDAAVVLPLGKDKHKDTEGSSPKKKKRRILGGDAASQNPVVGTPRDNEKDKKEARSRLIQSRRASESTTQRLALNNCDVETARLLTGGAAKLAAAPVDVGSLTRTLLGTLPGTRKASTSFDFSTGGPSSRTSDDGKGKRKADERDVVSGSADKDKGQEPVEEGEREPAKKRKVVVEPPVPSTASTTVPSAALAAVSSAARPGTPITSPPLTRSAPLAAPSVPAAAPSPSSSEIATSDSGEKELSIDNSPGVVHQSLPAHGAPQSQPETAPIVQSQPEPTMLLYPESPTTPEPGPETVPVVRPLAPKALPPPPPPEEDDWDLMVIEPEQFHREKAAKEHGRGGTTHPPSSMPKPLRLPPVEPKLEREPTVELRDVPMPIPRPRTPEDVEMQDADTSASRLFDTDEGVESARAHAASVLGHSPHKAHLIPEDFFDRGSSPFTDREESVPLRLMTTSSGAAKPVAHGRPAPSCPTSMQAPVRRPGPTPLAGLTSTSGHTSGHAPFHALSHQHEHTSKRTVNLASGSGARPASGSARQLAKASSSSASTNTTRALAPVKHKYQPGPSMFTEPGLRQRLKGILPYPILSGRATVISRECIAQAFGCHTQDVYACAETVVVQGGADEGRAQYEFVFVSLKRDCDAPKTQGAPGLVTWSGATAPWAGRKVKLMVELKENDWMYVGEYKAEMLDALSPEEFRELSDSSKWAWAKAIAAAKAGPDLAARARIHLRHQNPPVDPTNENVANLLRAVKGKENELLLREGGAIARAYREGHERVYVWRFQCVGYDEKFEHVLGEKGRAFQLKKHRIGSGATHGAQ